jgi:tRNA-2-methylthio-N6-dimethylallyladenosine synthase
MKQTELAQMTSPNVSKRVYIKTYGCQMNVYDSARMADLLEPYGYLVVETARDADW